jgi:hypothetical protein
LARPKIIQLFFDSDFDREIFHRTAQSFPVIGLPLLGGSPTARVGNTSYLRLLHHPRERQGYQLTAR